MAILWYTATSMMLRSCYALIKALGRKKYPRGVIIIGGAHINADPEIIIPMGVKYGLRGEGEESSSSFCRAMLGGNQPDFVSGLIINDTGSLSIRGVTVIYPKDEPF